jgi:hypothetical protein
VNIFKDVGEPNCGGALREKVLMSAMQKFLAALLALSVPMAGVSLGDEPVKVERGSDGPRPFTMRLPQGFAPGDYWIGAMCTPVEPALRAQLKLKDREGLVIQQIVPESPAAKAGLERYDVVTAIDGESIDDLTDLMKAVHEAEGKKISFSVVRGGEKKTVDVTPAERPEEDRFTLRLPEGPGGGVAMEAERLREHSRRLQEQIEQLRDRLPDAEIKRMEEWVEQLRRGEQQPLRMQMFGPGVVMRKFEAPALPPGVTVRVERQGNEPAKVHVERGDEQWDVTEKELDKLPEDLRGPVGAMLGGPGNAVMLHGPHGAAAAIAGGSEGPGKMKVEIGTNEASAPGLDPQQALQDAQRRMHVDMQRLNKELESLRKKVDEMKQLQKNPPAKKPARDEA